MKIFSSLILIILVFLVQSQNAKNNNTQKVNNTQINNQTKPQNNTNQQQTQNVKPQPNKAQNTTDTKSNKIIQNNNQTDSKNATQKTASKEQQNQNKANQTQNNNNKQNKKPQKNQQEQKNNTKQENAQKKDQQNKNKNEKKENKPPKNEQNKNIPKKENGKPEKPKEKNITVEQPSPKEKPFNLTESLIHFFQETFGVGNITGGDKNKSEDLAKEKSAAELEEIKKRREAEMEQKIIQERERKRREEFEARARAEMIKVENERKEQKKKIEQEQREIFERQLQNMTFDDYVQINLEKGETESLYLDLESFTKIRLAFILTDEEKRVNFIFSGPNPRGRTSVLYRADNKNYLYYEYETLRKGEYIIEIKNRGSEENELVLVLNEKVDKKSDVLGSEKIDKISMLLNTIDGNINQLRNKKKIEIRQINSHNDKVNKNNKSIVIYSIIEIFTMIFVFVAQSYYINSIVTNL